MFDELLAAIFGVLLVGFGAWLVCAVLDFIVEIPKQLKRIADALEWRNRHGK